MKMYGEDDANFDSLKGKKIAVIGFGSQGAAQALCMKDSGLDVIIGLAKNSNSVEKAKDFGFEVFETAEAVKNADIIHVLIPDEVQAEVYEKDIKPNLHEGNVLSFSHGFNICYEFIKPPENVDVIMVAPKAPGTEERKEFVNGFGVPGLIAIEQNFSGNAKDIALGMAKGLGLTRAGVLECTFKQETFEDLFGEQAVLCGGTAELVKAGFETLVERGYPAEMAYFECLHELKLIVDLMYEGGLTRMWDVVSNTAEYGGRTRGGSIIGPHVKQRMHELLDDIESGKFANEWINESRNGLENLKKLRGSQDSHEIEQVGREIRSLFRRK